MYNQITRKPIIVLKRKTYDVTVLNPSTGERGTISVHAVTRKDAVLDSITQFRTAHDIASNVQLFCDSVTERKITVGASAGEADPKPVHTPRPPAPWKSLASA
jgi:hypothetical protein